MSPEQYCKGCVWYEMKDEFAMAVNDFSHELRFAEKEENIPVSRWDFRTCLHGCYKKDREIAEDNRRYANLRYHRNHPNAPYRGQK